MSKPFDATLNSLIDAGPADWVALLAPRAGLAPGPAEVVDTDLSVTAQADKVFRLAGPPAALLHVELEANPRRGIPGDLLRYNVLVGHGHDTPVHSVLLLLRPKANAADLTGRHARPGADGRPVVEFRYAVVRVWKESVAGLLAGGPTTAPLALLTDEAAADLDAAFARFVARLRRPDVDGKLADDLLGSTYVLGGLRYADARLAALYRSVSMLLEDSTTYQAILRKGETQGETRGVARGRAEGHAEGERDAARRLVLLLAGKRFGPAAPAQEAAVREVTDPARLERLAERVLDAAGWDDLLASAD